MAGRLGGEQEVAAGVEHGPADGLAGVQVVAEVHRAQRGAAAAVGLQPALGGLALAVLLVGAVPGGRELRRQRQRLRPARRHDVGGEHPVEVLGAAVAALVCRAVVAADVARAEELRAVQGDEDAAVEAAHRFESAARVEVLDERVERVVEVRRRDAVEQAARQRAVPDMVAARDARQPEQGVRVGAAAVRGERPLVRQGRRRLHEEHRQRRHADVGHRVAPVAAAARVRQFGEARPQPVEMAREVLHGGAPASTAMIAASTARRSAGGIAR